MNNGKKTATAADKMTTLAVIVVIIAVLCLGIYATYGKLADNIYRNKVENGEIPMNVKYASEQAGMSVEDYLAQYQLTLSDEVTEDTPVSELYGYMTLENYMNMANSNSEEQEEELDIDSIIADWGLTDKVTRETLWKDVEAQIPVGKYLGEEQLNQYKQVYGITDEEVTAETTYSDFQKIIEGKAANLANATAAPANDAENAEAPADEAAEENADAPAEE